MESEKVTERHLVTQMTKHGHWSIKLLCNFVTGLPDRLCMFQGGRVVFVEVKSEGLDASKIQAKQHRKLRGLGFVVLVIDKKEQVDKLIERMNYGN